MALPAILLKKVGPLPVWAWTGAVVGGLALRYLRRAPTQAIEPTPDEGADAVETRLPSGGLPSLDDGFRPSPDFEFAGKPNPTITIEVKSVPTDKPVSPKPKPKPETVHRRGNKRHKKTPRKHQIVNPVRQLGDSPTHMIRRSAANAIV